MNEVALWRAQSSLDFGKIRLMQMRSTPNDSIFRPFLLLSRKIVEIQMPLSSFLPRCAFSPARATIHEA